MPITTWKIMLRRAGQAGYHYVSTHQKGWAPSVGEQVEFIVEGKTVKMTIAETFKDRSSAGWPHGDQHVPGLMEGIIKAAPAVFLKYGLGTPIIGAHFLAHARAQTYPQHTRGHDSRDRICSILQYHARH